ncbi:MAG: RluA family pseudouridine synthase [Clostridia bacterium]|nr:RluA family pseudouridine synthase [Clostridia bacterium]
MKNITIDSNAAGQRLDKWLCRTFPAVGYGLAQKLLRQNKVRVNGLRAKAEYRLVEGDVVALYMDDALLAAAPRQSDRFLRGIRPQLRIVYEDEDILIVDKPVGLLCHPDANEKVRTLITEIRAYLYQKGEYDSSNPEEFTPVLCNRIDRFTGGLVLAAKTESAMRSLTGAIREHRVEKRYLCIVFGMPKPSEGQYIDYFVHPQGAKRVQVVSRAVPNGKKAITQYRTIATQGALSLLECTLLTGRTHQIRAQLAFHGHPLLGDGQYGNAKDSARYGMHAQALYSHAVALYNPNPDDPLYRLDGQEWRVRSVSFVRQFFPEVEIP